MNERMTNRHRITGRKSARRIRRRLARICVAAVIYLLLLAAAVTAILGCVWILKNNSFGLLIVTGMCLLAGSLLFFHFPGEEKKAGKAGSHCIFPPQPIQ